MVHTRFAARHPHPADLKISTRFTLTSRRFQPDQPFGMGTFGRIDGRRSFFPPWDRFSQSTRTDQSGLCFLHRIASDQLELGHQQSKKS